MSELNQQDIARAVTNDPSLSTVEVTLGERTFKIVDLPYDDYVKFIAKLQPMLEAVAAKIMASTGIEPHKSSTMGITEIMQYCTASVPELALLVCKQTDPEITLEEVKRLGKTPFRLATLVLKQVEQNNIIGDVGDFFVQILPLLRMNPRQ